MVDDWNSFQESVQSYDRALSDLREAVTRARSLHVVKSEPLPPLPPGYKLDYPSASDSSSIDFSAIGGKKVAPPKIDWSEYDRTRAVAYYDRLARKWTSRDWFAENAPGAARPAGNEGNTPGKIQEKNQTKTQGQYTAADIDTTVEIPATTQNWGRPDPSFLPPGAQLVTGIIVTRLSFSPQVGEES